MKSIFTFFLTLSFYVTFGQSGSINTHAVYPDNNGSSAISFEIESTVPIEITSISHVFNTGSLTGDVWINPGGITTTTPPLNMGAGSGWVIYQSGLTITGGGGIGSAPVPMQGLNPIAIPANTPIGIVITGSMRYSGLGGSPPTPTSFVDGPVTLRTGGTKGYGGIAPGSMTNNPRGFLGIVDYVVTKTGINNLGVLSIDSPTVFCPGVFDVYATIQNNGRNVISTATVNWSVDGIIQTPFSFTGTLDTIGGTGNSTAQVLLGNYNFSTNNPYDVIVWTSSPNGGIDTINANDTLQAFLQSNLPPPSNISASAIAATQATLNWSGGSANTWLYSNVASGSPPIGPGIAVTSASATITGLQPKTAYDFYVREVCPTGDTSLWAGPFTYQTPFLCPPNAYCFTTCGAIGRLGPSQTDCNTAYNGTPLSGQVTVNGGIQEWTLPAGGLYEIEVSGAQGFGTFGGRGARMKGDFLFSGGETLKILVGQKGAPPVGSGTNQFGGGGGSFITDISNNPIIIAGGGGGSWASTFTTITDASTTTTGNTGGGVGSTGGTGGTAGQGGLTNISADGGGGLLGNGTGTAGGFAFINGGNGGVATASGGEGGFGGGGGASSFNNRRSGGGGGYSGGGGAHGSTTGFPEGGGGGSFNSGTNQINFAGANVEDGQIIIRALSTGATNDVGIVGIDSPTVFCPGVEDVWASINNYGTNQVTSVTVNWTVDGVLQTPATFNGILDTIGGLGNSTSQILLGSFNFSTNNPYNVSVWTSNPNGATDTVPQNDTASRVLQSSLPAPTGLATSNTFATQTNVSWNPGALANSWLWINVPTGTAPSGIGTASSNPTTLVTGLTQNTTYDFYVREVCPSGDTSIWAGPLTYTTPCAIYIAPFYENFDGPQWSLVSPFDIDQCWTKNPPAPVTGYRWQNEDGQPTSGTTTGPNSDFSGTGKYVYTESSSGSTGNTTELESPPIDISGLTVPQVEFFYHMHGATTGTMELEIFDNGVWTSIWSLSGPQQSNNTDPWLKATVPFTSVSDTIQFRFKGTRGTSFTSDMAIDEVRLREAPTCPDLTNLVSGNLTPNTALLRWVSFGNGNNFQVQYGNAGFTLGNGTIVPSIDTFVTITSLTSNTQYDWYVREICTIGDTSAWSTRSSFITPCDLYTAPFFEDFDGSQWSLVTPFDIDQCWSKNPPAPVTGFRWQTEDGQPTSGTTTGPNADVSGLGKYVYTESSSGLVGNITELESPLINISSLSAPQVEFFYHMHGATTGTMELEINDNGVWTSVWSLSGPQQTANTDPWINVAVPFTTVSDTIQFRFKGTRGTSFTGDMAIDEVRVRDAPNNDLAVTNVTGLQTACGLGSNESFSVEIENKGAFTQNNFDIEYSINGAPFVTGFTVTTPLTFAQSQTYTVAGVDLSGPGQKCIDVRVALPNDEDTTNNVFPQICILNQLVPTIDQITDEEICNGGTLTLQVAFTGDNLNWYDDPGLTNLVNTGSTYTANFSTTTTLYVRAINANGCTSPALPIVAEVNFTPAVNFTFVRNDCTVNFTSNVGTNVDSVRWDFGDLAGGTSTLPNPSYTYNQSQTYVIRLTAWDGTCVNDTTKSTFVTCPVGLVDEAWSESISIYPNPSKGEVTITIPQSDETIQIQVMDMSGQTIFTETYSNDGKFSQNIDLREIADGVYFMHVKSGDKEAVKKLMIK